MTYKTIILL